MWKKEFILEFFRDRKFMSVYCFFNKFFKNGGVKMFCKVNIYMYSVRRIELCCVKFKVREKVYVIVILYIILYLFFLYFKYCIIFLIINIIFYIYLFFL